MMITTSRSIRCPGMIRLSSVLPTLSPVVTAPINTKTVNSREAFHLLRKPAPYGAAIAGANPLAPMFIAKNITRGTSR